jgi:hypothetical protein
VAAVVVVVLDLYRKGKWRMPPQREGCNEKGQERSGEIRKSGFGGGGVNGKIMGNH